MKGKRAHNALLHGLYSRAALLPWEDAKEFEAFYESVRQELNPSGPLEEDAVRECAELLWRKRRLAWGEVLPYYKNPPSPLLKKSVRRGVPALADFLAKRIKLPPSELVRAEQARDEILAALDGDHSESEETSAPPPRQISDNLVATAYDPARYEAQLRIEAMIDSRITKAMARLVSLKEFKRLYSQTLLPDSPS